MTRASQAVTEAAHSLTSWSLRWPVLQAPMAGGQGHALAAAVSLAGGLGALPAAMWTPAQLAEEVQAFRQAAGNAPLNINFFCHTPPVMDDAQRARLAAWAERLRPHRERRQLPPDAHIDPSPARAPFSTALAEVLEAHLPDVVSFHFGLPEAALLQRVRALGCRVISSATTLAEGVWLQGQGVDAVIAQGWEAGGHRGHFLGQDVIFDLGLQLPTLALTRQLVGALEVPVIAAGGVVDAATARACAALGAAAVQVGTAYLLCPEATTGDVHRAALLRAVDQLSGKAVDAGVGIGRGSIAASSAFAASAGAWPTQVTNLFTGRPARGLTNSLMRECGALWNEAPHFPLMANQLAPLRAAAEAVGDDAYSPLWCGQGIAGCRVLPAAELTRSIGAGFLAA